jgi:hypothetical protein
LNRKSRLKWALRACAKESEKSRYAQLCVSAVVHGYAPFAFFAAKNRSFHRAAAAVFLTSAWLELDPETL